jgi:rubredoxin
MIQRCESCEVVYDDEKQNTICPHTPIDLPLGTPYCRQHDLFRCPFCTDSPQDAYGRTSRVEKGEGDERI